MTAMSDDQLSAAETASVASAHSTKGEDARRSVLGAAFGKILGANVALDGDEDGADCAILAKRPAISRKMKEDALEQRARRQLRREEKLLRDKAHRPLPAVSNREKMLRKTATAGVVRLFNALHTLQVSRSREALAAQRSKEARLDAARIGVADASDAAAGHNAPAASIAADVRSMTKASFLDMLKHGSRAN